MFPGWNNNCKCYKLLCSTICLASWREGDTFWNKIISYIAVVPDEEMLLSGGDFDGHVLEHSARFEGFHGGHGNGGINQGGLWIIDFYVTNKLAVVNTFFQKNISRLITYSSGGSQTQTDYILVKKPNQKH